MIENIRKIGVLLERTADRLLLIITSLILWGLTYYSARYTEVLQDGTEIPITVPDSIGRNLIFLLAVIIIFFLLHTLLSKSTLVRSDRARKIAIAAATAYITIASVTWAAICHVTPRADSAKLCQIAKYTLQGIYDTMVPPGYMSYTPHQYGLLAVIQLLYRLFGAGNYEAFQYMNALCIPLLFYSGYRLLMLLYGRFEPVMYYIAAFVSCLPLFLYVPYVYGEIASITFTMVLMWQVTCYCMTGKKTCWLWGTLAIVSACIVRSNSLIVLIAAGIVLAIHAFRTASPHAVVWLFAMILAVSAANGCIRAYYERVSGNEVFDGIPYISWVLMGLHDGEDGPGWFDGTNYNELELYDYDTAITAAVDRKAVTVRLKELWKDKPYAFSFFRRKILSQWNSPAYHSFFETDCFKCELDELPKCVHQIYYDRKDQVHMFMNQYQFILYLCTAIATTSALFSQKRACGLEAHVLLIAVTGGFLFSILWEAMSRYILPYIVYMIPMAAAGMWQLQEHLTTWITKLRR